MPRIEEVYQQIVDFAQLYDAQRVILFGSRARGDELPNSDIDLAIEGCRAFNQLEEALQEDLWSLLQIDVVNLDEHVAPQLKYDILRDGKVLYEKV